MVVFGKYAGVDQGTWLCVVLVLLCQHRLEKKVEELQKSQNEELKARKKEENDRKKEIVAAKKRLTREIQTAKGTVRKRSQEVGTFHPESDKGCDSNSRF